MYSILHVNHTSIKCLNFFKKIKNKSINFKKDNSEKEWPVRQKKSQVNVVSKKPRVESAFIRKEWPIILNYTEKLINIQALFDWMEFIVEFNETILVGNGAKTWKKWIKKRTQGGKVYTTNRDNPFIMWKGERKLGGSCKRVRRIVLFSLEYRIY